MEESKGDVCRTADGHRFFPATKKEAPVRSDRGLLYIK